jgi:hypothetical protein
MEHFSCHNRRDKSFQLATVTEKFELLEGCLCETPIPCVSEVAVCDLGSHRSLTTLPNVTAITL